MKKIFNETEIKKALLLCNYAELLEQLKIPLFLIEYEAGESISNYNYFQVVLKGNLSISFIRDDGSTYSLSIGGENYIIGEMDLFTKESHHVIAEATTSLLTIAIDAGLYKEQLLSDNAFLRLTATVLADKLSSITNNDAAPSSLPERILNYMTYKVSAQ